MIRAYRSSILHFTGDPDKYADRSYDYFVDGLLVVENGKVVCAGEYTAIRRQLDTDCLIEHFPNKLILPGFIDGHVHYPQTEVIAAHGEQLLTWLNRYVFPAEAKYADYDYAQKMAELFVRELLRNGTTTAMVFATMHPQSVDAFFSVCQRHQLRMISGKVLMDRNAPHTLCESADDAIRRSRQLIEHWHGNGRLRYALTPRFAPCCSSELLRATGQLMGEYAGVYLHTHWAENRQEVEWVKDLFPECEHYLDVYKQAGLLSPYSVFAHGVHADDQQYHQLASHQCSVVHCPTSNLFLGSGLFPLKRYRAYNVPVLLGTDVGAGTSFSLLSTMGEAYKVQQLQGQTLGPLSSYYMATLGAASALQLDSYIGNFLSGKEADFVLLNPHATPLLSRRYQQCETLEEKLFALQTLGDDRVVEKTFILGKSF